MSRPRSGSASWVPARALIAEILWVAAVAWLAIGRNLARLAGDFLPPHGDFAFHLMGSAAFEALLTAPLPWWERLALAWTWPGPYPPGVYALGACFRAGLSPGPLSALLGIQPFLVLLALGVHGLVHAGAGVWAARVATLWILSAPPVLIHARQYLLDLPLAAMVALGLCALVRCRGFQRRRWSWAVGLGVGLGMLVKFTFFWFLGAPLLWVAARVWLQARAGGRLPGLGRQLLCGLLGALWVLGLAWVGSRLGGEVLEGRELVTPRSWFLIGAVTVSGALLWRLGPRCRGGVGPADPAVVHALQALSLAWIVAGPWYLANQAILAARWDPVASHLPSPAALLAQGLGRLGLDLGEAVAAAFTGLGCLLAARSWRAPVPGLTWAALASGGLLTLGVLGLVERYHLPARVLVGVLAVVGAWGVRPVRLVIVGLALVQALGNLSPSLPWPERALGRLVAHWSGRERLDRAGSFWSEFDLGEKVWARWEPAWREAGSARRILVVLDPDHPGRSHELWYALEAWAHWSRLAVVPILASVADGRVEVHHLDPYEVPRWRRLLRAAGAPPALAPPGSVSLAELEAVSLVLGFQEAPALGGGWRAARVSPEWRERGLWIREPERGNPLPVAPRTRPRRDALGR